MSRKVLLYSDPHFHNYKAHSTLKDGVNSRLLDGLGTLDQAREIAVVQKCKAFLIAGDIFHVRGNLRPSVYNRVHRALAKVGEDVFVAAIPGNHDMENFRDGESAVDSLPIAGVLKNSGAILNGIHVHGIPYCHDISEFKEKFDEAALTVEPDIFMIHQGIDNFSGGGMPLTGLTAEWLNSYLAPGQFVVAGHYHCWGRSGAVIQVGAPYQQAFGDENEKGCFVLDLDSGESEFFKLEAPKFVTVESLKDVGVRHLVGDFVRVKAKTLATGEKIAEAARLAGAASVVLDIERVYSKAHSETIKITADPVEMISKYIDIEGERYSPDDKRDILGLFEVIRC